MKLFVPGMPHTQTNDIFNACPHTGKAKRFCTMMGWEGFEVIHLGNEGSDVDCEHVDILSKKEFYDFYKYDTHDPLYVCNINDEIVKNFNIQVASEISKRYDTGDIVCYFYDGQQLTHKILKEKNCIQVEASIGYGRCYAEFRVFESYAWLNFKKGEYHSNFKHREEYPDTIPNDPDIMFHETDGRFNKDTVIHNFMDLNNFDPTQEKEDYCMFIGRIIPSKGISEAVAIASMLNMKLIIAGQGDYVELFGDPPEHVELFGHANLEQRKELMAKAKFGIVYTHYCEPFGNVVTEYGASDTGVVTSNRGAFVETVVHGITGYRCDSVDQAIRNAKQIDKIKPGVCRTWIENNFSMASQAPKYKEYLDCVSEYVGSGRDPFYFNTEKEETQYQYVAGFDFVKDEVLKALEVENKLETKGGENLERPNQ